MSPGVTDDDEWRDWSDQVTTADQERIEDYIDRHDLRGKSILHIGVGNSGLAMRFRNRAKSILGTTVVPGELERATALGIGNYRAILHNKYSGAAEDVAGKFDFIVDNNPTTFCCCMSHLDRMLQFYTAKLTPSGQVVTDRVGLGWAITAPGSHPRWGFSFEDLAAAATLVGLNTYRIDANIYVLSRRPVERPRFRWRATHSIRSLWRRTRRRLKSLASISST